LPKDDGFADIFSFLGERVEAKRYRKNQIRFLSECFLGFPLPQYFENRLRSYPAQKLPA